jgi:hypothetical protein
MKGVIAVISVLSLSTQALAADRYQLIPLYANVGNQGTQQVLGHTAVVIDTQGSDIWGCEAVFNVQQNRFTNLGCGSGP